MKRIAIIILFAYLLLLAACQDMKNLDDEAHVLALGIDAGEERSFSYTVQIPDQAADAAENGGFTLHSAEADSVYEAIDLINAALPWRLSFTHLNAIAISGDLAAGGYLKEIAGISPSRLGFRTTCPIILVKGGASGFFEGMRGNGVNLAKRQRAWMLEPGESALFPECTYSELAESLTDPIYAAIMPLGGKKDDASAVLGCALVNGGAMIAEFSASETLALMLARGEFQQGWYYFDESAVFLRLARPREARVISWNPLRLSLSVHVKCDAAGSDGAQDAAAARIERSVEESLRAELAALFEECRRLGADAFQLGKSAVAGFMTSGQWEDYAWDERLREAQLDIIVECVEGGV